MSIKWYQLLFQIINFGILVFVLNKFLYKPILKIIDQRNRKLHDSIKAAEHNLKEKAKLEELKKMAVQEAEKEAIRIVEQARGEAKETSKSIIEAAKQEAEQEVDKKFGLMQEKLAEEETKLEAKVADLVIKTTSQVLKKSLTPKEQEAIIDKEISQLGKSLR
jgi:F-type H+-transporting ATPase subunit b